MAGHAVAAAHAVEAADAAHMHAGCHADQCCSAMKRELLTHPRQGSPLRQWDHLALSHSAPAAPCAQPQQGRRPPRPAAGPRRSGAWVGRAGDGRANGRQLPTWLPGCGRCSPLHECNTHMPLRRCRQALNHAPPPVPPACLPRGREAGQGGMSSRGARQEHGRCNSRNVVGCSLTCTPVAPEYHNTPLVKRWVEPTVVPPFFTASCTVHGGGARDHSSRHRGGGCDGRRAGAPG